MFPACLRLGQPCTKSRELVNTGLLLVTKSNNSMCISRTVYAAAELGASLKWEAHPLLLLAELMMHALILLVSLQGPLPPASWMETTLSQCISGGLSIAAAFHRAGMVGLFTPYRKAAWQSDCAHTEPQASGV